MSSEVQSQSGYYAVKMKDNQVQFMSCLTIYSGRKKNWVNYCISNSIRTENRISKWSWHNYSKWRFLSAELSFWHWTRMLWVWLLKDSIKMSPHGKVLSVVTGLLQKHGESIAIADFKMLLCSATVDYIRYNRRQTEHMNQVIDIFGRSNSEMSKWTVQWMN